MERGLEQKSDITKGYQRIETAVDSLKSIVHTWNREAILLFTGSYLLQLHTANADVDCIVLLPFAESSFLNNWDLLHKRFFFGNKIETKEEKEEEEEVLCDFDLESSNRICPIWSFYCVLCLNPDVKFLQRMYGRNYLPMIQVQLDDIQFYISFVSMPKKISDKLIFAANAPESANEPAELPLMPDQQEASSSSMSEKEEEKMIKVLTTVKGLDKMIANFIAWMGMHNMDARKGMLWTLSAYRANLQMRDLIEEKQFHNQFQTALLALKLWAKKHFVYGGIFGLLSGQTLTTMLLHVFLSENGHNHPVHLLLLKFFDTFIQWKWPIPLELEGNYEANFHAEYEELDWNERSEKYDRTNQLQGNLFLAKEHAQPVWPVIIPGFPTQNAAFNINGWTKHPIMREFKNGLAKMQSIHGVIMAKRTFNKDAIKQQWNRWLDGGNFHEKYNHFLAIVCAANSVQHVRTFCEFVESRIRLQLLFTFGDLHQVRWMHANPEKVRSGVSCPSSEKIHLPAAVGNDYWLCTIWLVGVHSVDHDHNTLFISRMESFAEKIYESFKHKERLVSSPRRLNRNISLPTRGSSVGSPREGKRQLAAAAYTRHSSMPILRKSGGSSLITAHQQGGSMEQSVEAESREKLLTKLFDKAQLQAWLEEMAMKETQTRKV